MDLIKIGKFIAELRKEKGLRGVCCWINNE